MGLVLYHRLQAAASLRFQNFKIIFYTSSNSYGLKTRPNFSKSFRHDWSSNSFQSMKVKSVFVVCYIQLNYHTIAIVNCTHRPDSKIDNRF